VNDLFKIKIDTPFSTHFMQSWSESIHASLAMTRADSFFQVRDLWGRSVLVYIPFLSYTDLTPAAASSLARSVENNLFRIRFLSPEYPAQTGDPVVSRLLLSSSSGETLWESFTPETRNRVRRAIKYGLSARITRLELSLGEFYKLYAETQSQLGVPVLPKVFFYHLAERCETALITIYYGNKLLACALQVKDRHLAWIPWICSSADGRGYASSDFMYWKLILNALDEGTELLDFGRSAKGYGVYYFKQKWGCMAIPVVTLGASSTSIYEKYSFAQKAWSKIPLLITTNLSKKLVSRLPDL
jgi:hypothetical protein